MLMITLLSDCLSLQNDLNSLSQWGTRSDMFFNPGKSVFMRITHKRNHIIYDYTINNIFIQEVSSTKYLGVTITNNLSWSTHITNITSKALISQSIPTCREILNHVQNWNAKIEYHGKANSIEYANPVWSSHTKTDINKLRRIQRQSARFIMADFSHFSSVTNMLIDLKIPSLEHHRQYSSSYYPLLQDHLQSYWHISWWFNLYHFEYQRTQPNIFARTNQYSNSFSLDQ